MTWSSAKQRYRAEVGSGGGYVLETGADGKKKQYRIEYALGGKNVFYFLTPMDRGRLQTLPVAYDVRKKEWFDTALSGLRHFPGQHAGRNAGGVAGVSLHLQHLLLRLPCQPARHQLRPEDGQLHAPPGKSRGSTARPATAVPRRTTRPCASSPRDEKPADTTDFKLIRTKKFTPAQHNDACNSCHSKAMPLTAAYKTPERFFDHFDLVTLENRDFYPDGRDLGENYTQTSWRMSPCVKGGKLHCVTCHTSSGRYRFKKEKFNNACLPCHEERVKNVAAHSHHPAESEGEQVHLLPYAEDRICPDAAQRPLHAAADPGHDHRLPVPQRLQRLPRGQGCRLGRQAGAQLEQARLPGAGPQAGGADRCGPQAGLDEAAGDAGLYQRSQERRRSSSPPSSGCWRHCDDPAKVPVLRAALNNPSPLVRGAAVEGLGQSPTLEVLQDIAAATGDDYRLVRVRAAAALAQFPNMKPQGKAKEQLRQGHRRIPGFPHGHGPTAGMPTTTWGTTTWGRTGPRRRWHEYDIAYKHEPQSVLTLVNAAMAHARLGETGKAEEKLNEALKIAPDSGAVLYNLGLIKGEKQDLPAAEKYLKAAFKADPQLAGAAYQSLHHHRQGPPGRGAGVVPEGGRAPSPGAEVRLGPWPFTSARVMTSGAVSHPRGPHQPGPDLSGRVPAPGGHL